MKTTFFLFITLVISSFAFSQTTWYVDANNTTGPWLGTQQYPFQYIQGDAVDPGGIFTAVNNDTVLVMPGTYLENLDFLGKAITVKSDQGAGVTIIDGGSPSDPDAGSVVTFQWGEGSGSVLDGFTLTNGFGSYVFWASSYVYAGGGIYCANYSSPTIINNIIKNNTTKSGLAGKGGGICCRDVSKPYISGNIISNNTAEDPTDSSHAGGIGCYWDSDAFIIDNTISFNKSDWGGGIKTTNSSPRIMGNTITGNTVDVSGGGLQTWDYHPEIIDNVITYNTSAYAGGMQCERGDPVIQGNTVSYNTTQNWCGGIRLFSNSPVIEKNIVMNNSAGNAGGMQFWDASPTVKDNIVMGNTASNACGGIHLGPNTTPIVTGNIIAQNSSSGIAGGIRCDESSSVEVSDNYIWGNSAGSGGGGISCGNYTTVTILNNVVSGNDSYSGGGINCGNDSDCEIMNNIIIDNTSNTGGGIRGYYCNVTVTNCTVASNDATTSGGGVYFYGVPGHQMDVMNSILWNNTSPTGPAGYVGGTSTLSIAYSDVEGGQPSMFKYFSANLIWGPGMIDSDPLFVDSPSGDLHLTYPSPCRDTGHNNGVPPTLVKDFEGDPRMVYGTVDMGADEFDTHLYYTGDATPGGTVSLKFVGLPATAPVAFFIGFGILDPPLPSMWGDWYLQFPVMGPLVLAPIPSSGVEIISGPLPGTPPAPYSIPMQAIIGAELTNLCVMEVE